MQRIEVEHQPKLQRTEAMAAQMAQMEQYQEQRAASLLELNAALKASLTTLHSMRRRG